MFSADSKQAEVFDECGRELCDKFLQGKNCNIIVYGPTSTGKTYTMQGDINTQAKNTIVKTLFEQIVHRETVKERHSLKRETKPTIPVV